MLTTEDPFGGDMKTCSISGAFMADNADVLIPQGMTEAMLSGAQAKGQLGVVFAKAAKGEIPKYAKVFEGLSPDGTKWSASYQGTVTFGKGNPIHTFDLVKVSPKGKVTNYKFNKNTSFVQEIMDEANWKFGSASKPTVSAGPSPAKASVGAMSDEDVSALFVTIKDTLAKEKGINIKGANPQLDALVHKEIGDRIGYTASEVAAKIEAYKATGKKLSALKKKVAKNPPKLPPKPKAAAVPDEVVVEKAKATAATATSDAFPAAKDYMVKSLEKKLAKGDVDYVKEVAASTSPSISQSAQKVLTEAGLEWNPKPTTTPVKTWDAEPNGVPVTPTTKIVDDVVEDMDSKGLMHGAYTDEDKAAQYIMAKDKVVADSDGKWTLYSQDPDLENAIYDMIQQVTGLKSYEVKKGVKNYTGSGKKLSALKKQLIKNGSMKKAAPTLKGGTKATKGNVKAFADKGFTPKDADPIDLSLVKQMTKEDIYSQFKMQPSGKYLTDSADATFAAIKKVTDDLAEQWSFTDLPKAPSMLDVLRIIDEVGAKKFGVANDHVFEKKVVEWMASPAGKKFAQAQAKADEMKKNMPPLPGDSDQFKVIDGTIARQIQDAATPWTREQREALRTYTGGSYRQMNNTLREGRRPTPTIQNAIDGMRPVDRPFLVRRGTGYSQFGVNSQEELMALVGETVADKGFMSTSVGGEAAFGGAVKMEIEVVKGTKGAYVQHISHYPGEREFVISPGTKMKVLRVDTLGYQTVVRLRVVL